MPGLVIKEARKSFGTKKVLDNISIELSQGELLVLLGPSGCGKTTLLRSIAGLEQLDSGEIYIGQRRVDKMPPQERNVALVFQNYSLYPHMTVEKNLAFPLKIAGMKRQEIKKRVNEISSLLGLADRLNDRPGQLSGGERQRVALGRAIIRNPDLFLLDEPLSNLDASLRNRMRREIVSLQKRLNKTSVHVTHDQEEALTMADRIAVMNNGRLEQVGTPEEIYRSPSSRFVAEFVGSPRINIVEAVVERHLLIPFGLSMLNNELRNHEGKVLLGIRPESIKVSPDGEWVGKIVSCEYLGDRYVTTLDFKGNLLSATSSQAFQVGAETRFQIDQNALHFFSYDDGRRIDGGN